MPRRDGSGPRGAGSVTGRGMGFCTGGKGYGLGLGMGYRRGSYPYSIQNQPTSKALLEEEKLALESRLEAINQQMKNTQ